MYFTEDIGLVEYDSMIIRLKNKGKIEDILEKPVIAEIPENIYFKKALKMKTPFVNLYPKSKIAKSFNELAKIITS